MEQPNENSDSQTRVATPHITRDWPGHTARNDSLIRYEHLFPTLRLLRRCDFHRHVFWPLLHFRPRQPTVGSKRNRGVDCQKDQQRDEKLILRQGSVHTVSSVQRSRSGRAGQARPACNRTGVLPLPAPRLLDHSSLTQRTLSSVLLQKSVRMKSSRTTPSCKAHTRLRLRHSGAPS